MEQMSIYDFIMESGLPCDDCLFDNRGCCDHVIGEECFCVGGSFQIRRKHLRCEACGGRIDIRQMEFGSDFGVCKRCGQTVIFNNQGNRKSAYELWREGRLRGE